MMHFYGRFENVQKCQEFFHFLENRLGVSNGWLWVVHETKGEPRLKWILIGVLLIDLMTLKNPEELGNTYLYQSIRGIYFHLSLENQPGIVLKFDPFSEKF